MHWQDIVIAIASWAASAALIPSLVSENKPSMWSSFFTFVVVSTFAVCYVTLGLFAAALSSALLALLWLALGVQKWRQHNAER